ncbi:MAG TPA: HEPN domain-containing protein [Gemmatimonadaceae bacterium]
MRAIVVGVRPTRVILFGSRARGDAKVDSDYDLVVELPFERERYWPIHSRVVEALSGARRGVEVDIVLRSPGEIERKRDDPGYMDWDIAREGVVLYPADTDDQSIQPSSRSHSRVREDASYGSIDAWLERIEQDLQMIEAALAQGESAAWGAAGFHAQQAAERYLKILFIQRGKRPPRTHQLDQLITELRQTTNALPPFEAECKLLNRYAVTIRYPECAPLPDAEEGREVIAAARRIIECARDLAALPPS